MKFTLTLLLVWSVVGISLAQTVSGTITDEAGNPLIGANILEVGTDNGTVTDVDGFYSFEPTGDNPTLRISYIGFGAQELVLNGRTTLDVTLTEGNNIDEVVVTALGVSRERKALGYATVELQTEDITKTQVTNFASALYGKAPGVSIRSTPGGATSGININIRGQASITGNTQPLIVLDGVPIRNGEFNNSSYWDDQRIQGNGLLDINPEDIANISVLKGASAAALYGSDAVNGVILITTKKGKFNQGLGVEFNASYNTDRIAYLPRYQNVRGPGYPVSLADAGQGADRFIGYDTDGDEENDVRGLINTSVNFGPNFDGQPVMAWDGVVRPYVSSENSYGDLFQPANSSNVNLAVSKGTEAFNFRVSLSRQDNQMISFNSKNERNILTFTTNYDINERLSSSLNVRYINQSTNNRPYKVDRMVNNFTGMMDRFESADWYFDRYKTSDGYYFRTGTQPSTTPEENIIYNGFKSDIADYVWRVNEYQSRENNNRVIANFTQRWNVIGGLNLQGRLSTDYTAQETESWNSTELPSALYNNPGGAFSLTNYTENLLYGDVILNYDLDVTDDISLGVLAGYTARKYDYALTSIGTVNGLSPENKFDLSASRDIPQGRATRATEITDGLFTSLSFGFKTFWFVEGTIRRDRISTIAPGNNSFSYPSVNSSLILNEIFDLPRSISYAKLRASYGVVGNYPGRYLANINYIQNTLGVQSGGGSAVIYTNLGNAFGNELIRPERKKEVEFGINLNFLNRFRVDATYYNGRIIDQILPVDVPTSSGATTVLTNIGVLRNEGMEFSLGADIIRNENFNWTTTINFARNINTVEQLANDATQLIHADFDGNAAQVRSVVGRPMGDIYAHPVATDANDNRIVGPNGLYQLDGDNWEVYGNALPDFEGGFLTTLGYKFLTLNFVADFSYGGSIMPTGIYWMTSRGLTEESLNYMDAESGGLRYYQNEDGQGVQTTANEGPNGELVFNDGILLEGVNINGEPNTNVVSQARYYNGTYNWGGPQYGNSRYELYINENNWVKVRELALGFNLPTTWLSGVGMQNANISVYGRNIFFIYRSIKDLDPEQTTAGSRWYQNINNAGNNPSFRSFGVQFKTSF
ncbi:TonB-linked SusC/RagA family outer membrane protein [Neolewinella xylanilytica]|uniref:TonB-linked SusC/RagA family outer membrane protein n=1 Tax=Neolewinella xylanilytica TaxID=1514080 RepID=A0A2S6I8F3_9BACT|nr:SusC/RagA family TonB-linked outer membrane protein [Neolewinella xylanilytica]PPK87759.1 TonB-linked SusC/RagA family outer membrane protein [Neolewinella xylanilytica]